MLTFPEDLSFYFIRVLLKFYRDYLKIKVKFFIQNKIWKKDCPNGKLDKKKFASTFSELYPGGNPEKYSGYVFEHFDADNSKFISFSEFLLVISALSDKELSKRLSLAFKIIDFNDDHKVDAKELANIIDAIYDLKAIQKNERKGENSAKNMATTIFNKLNKDANKYLSEDEFVDGCLNEPTFVALLLPP